MSLAWEKDRFDRQMERREIEGREGWERELIWRWKRDTEYFREKKREKDGSKFGVMGEMERV